MERVNDALKFVLRATWEPVDCGSKIVGVQLVEESLMKWKGHGASQEKTGSSPP